MNKKTSVILFLIFLGALSLSPLYSLAYITALIVATRTIRFSNVFSTTIGRVVLSFLLLTISIMIVGVFTWLIGAPTLPVLVIALFGAVILLLKKFSDKETPTKKFADRGDVISIGLALVFPILFIASYYTAQPAVGVFQFLSTGWDNGAHINILQNASEAKGYVYKATDGGANQSSIEKFSAYPQGWHLATANIINGFGFPSFNKLGPVATMYVYLTACLLWFLVSAYCFMRVSWSIGDKFMRKKMRLPLSILSFAMASLLILLIVFVGSFGHGFANYLGVLAYLATSLAMVVGVGSNNKPARYMASLCFGVAVILTWLLPLPAVALMIALFFAPRSYKQLKLKLTGREAIFYYATTALALLLVMFQVAIFVLFNRVDGSQLNAGSVFGSYPISTLLVALVILFSFFWWLKHRNYADSLVFSVGSFVFLSSAIYFYQTFSGGTPSYYFWKTVGLALVVAAIFFVPAYAAFIRRAKDHYKLSAMAVSVIAVGSIGLMVIGTQQPTNSFNYLFQRYSRIGYPTAGAIVNYLKNTDTNSTRLAILRDETRKEDRNSYLYNKLPNHRYSCASTVGFDDELDEKLSDASKCAAELAEKNIQLVIITSNKTHKKVLALNHENIRTVKIP